MLKWIRRIWIVAGLGFVVFLVWNTQARGVSPTVFRSTSAVRVIDSGALMQFVPAQHARGAGLIFLPGGMIDPDAYAPFLRAVAESGYTAVLIRMPWRTALTEAARKTLWSRIDGVSRNAQPGRRWVLGGHSRGAALAATYAWEHGAQLAGLVLIGTTHPRVLDLSTSPIPIAKIYGTRDCVADSAKMMSNANRLPLDTRWIRIEGGNHRQFGYYGYQLGDCSATISRAAQHGLTTRAVTAFLKEQ